jgi:hypothetical protein
VTPYPNLLQPRTVAGNAFSNRVLLGSMHAGLDASRAIRQGAELAPRP